jgi:arginine:ornithine antiporter/lysine permease
MAFVGPIGFWARSEQGKKIFTKPTDWIIFLVAVVGCVLGIYWLATGYIVI